MIRKAITSYPVRSSDNSRGLRGPTLDEADSGSAGGIPSLAPKKKTHGASALLLIACSVSMFRLARFSAGQSAVAGRSAGHVEQTKVFREWGMKSAACFSEGGQLGKSFPRKKKFA
jgi:hypothetical protein